MLYLFIVVLFLSACLYLVLQNFNLQLNRVKTGQGQRPSLLISLLGYVVPLSLSAPLITTFYVVFKYPDGSPRPLSMGDGRISIYVMMAASLACFYIGYLAYKRSALMGTKPFWAAGLLVVSCLAGGYGLIAGYKQLSFFSSTDDGWANFGVIKDMANISDMPNCPSDIVLIHRTESGPIKYRCPTVVLLNRHTAQPFAPWPSYVEGQSQQLADALHQFEQNAETLDPSVTK